MTADRFENGPALLPQGRPLPTPQIMSQWWRDIVFLHWPVEPRRIADRLPAGVRPDLYDGTAWVGLIPFRMVGAGLGRGGPVPRLGTFLEMNVRVYSVDDRGRRGVVFLSLEAQRALVVAGAVGLFNVPYRWASMQLRRTSPTVDRHGTLAYSSRRFGSPAARSRVAVEVGERLAEPSPLDHFLTARFGLHTTIAGRTRWVPNTHGPWPLHRARLTELADGLVGAAGLAGVSTSEPPHSVLCSPGVRTTFGVPVAL